MTDYRPMLLARAGEMTALKETSASTWIGLTPVLIVPPREWNYESEDYGKTLEEHYSGLPSRFTSALGANEAFVDLSLLDSDAPIFGGIHPLVWLVEACAADGTFLTPLVTAASTPAFVAATKYLHDTYDIGTGIKLTPAEWLTVDPAPMATLVTALGIGDSRIDLFVDCASTFGPLVHRSLMAELEHQERGRSFRSTTVGAAGFPDTAGLAKGVSEFDRDDWMLYLQVAAARNPLQFELPGFFDNVVQNPDSVEVGVNPRFMSISAMLRYTTDDQWLIAKGDLFKGPAGRSKGGAALIPALKVLVAHPKYGTPISSKLDTWVAEVLATTSAPGGPQQWRMWATIRHLDVVVTQLSSVV